MDISAWIIFVLCKERSWKSDIFYVESRHSLSSKGYNTMHTSITIPRFISRELVQSFEDPKSQGSWLTHQMLNPTPPPGLSSDHSQHAKWQLWAPKLLQ